MFDNSKDINQEMTMTEKFANLGRIKIELI